MAYNVNNIVAGQNSVLYEKTYNASNALPTLAAYGVAWSGYTDMGGTQNGINLQVTVNTNDVFIDQALDPVLKLFASRNAQLTTDLAEFTPANMQSATGQGSTGAVAAGSGTRGSSTWTMTDVLTFNYYTFGVETQNPFSSEAVQFLIYRGFPTGGPTSKVGAKNDNAKIPVTIQALPGHPTGILAVRDVIAALP